MDLGLEGHAVIVGGASRGIGLAVAREFLAERADVALLARDEEGLLSAAQELQRAHPERRVVSRSVDLRDGAATSKAVAEAAGELGGVDCAVAVAGTGVGIRGWDVPPEEWARLLEANLSTATNLCRAAAATVSDGGALALVASIGGLTHLAAPLPYTAAKAALIRYGKDLSHALAPRRVRINIVAPGNVLFPGGRWEELRAADPAGVEDFIGREVPLGRFGSPDEVAAAVVFLCSERCGFVTGACLPVDGGQLGD
jgi:3-oxoacyl-[acyl-carrier protein] reductase